MGGEKVVPASRGAYRFQGRSQGPEIEAYWGGARARVSRGERGKERGV